jgi:hypothetical protein
LRGKFLGNGYTESRSDLGDQLNNAGGPSSASPFVGNESRSFRNDAR